MKHYSHYSLAALIPMAIWGVGSPAQAADDSTPDETKRSAAANASEKHDETMVVTAAAQTLQAPVFPSSLPMKSANIHPHATSPN